MQIKNKRVKGCLLAAIATLAVSNVYIFSKSALDDVHLIQFGFYWFGFAVIWNILYGLKTNSYKKITRIKAKTISLLLFIAVIEICATGSIFHAIQVIKNPTVPSFLRNTEPIFIAILGFFFLHERFNRIEQIGAALTLSGAVLVSLKGELIISDIFLSGSLFVFLAAFFYAIRTVIAKAIVHKIAPILLNLNKIFNLFLFSFVLMLLFGKSFIISQHALIMIVLGSLLGPFLTSFAHYSSLKYIEASKSTLIQSSAGIFVVIGAFIYFGITPMIHQLIGGILTIAGILLVTMGQKIFSGKAKC